MIDIKRRLCNQLGKLGYMKMDSFIDKDTQSGCIIEEIFFSGRSGIFYRACRVTIINRKFTDIGGGINTTILVSFDHLSDHNNEEIKNASYGLFIVQYYIPDEPIDPTFKIPYYNYEIIYSLDDETQKKMCAICDLIAKANKQAAEERLHFRR